MRHWSLGAKLTACSALIVGAVLLICSFAAVLFIQREQLEALDDQLRNEAHTFFGEVSRHDGGLDWSNPAEVKAILPITRTQRLVTVIGPSGRTLHQSGPTNPVQFGAHLKGSQTLKSGEHTIRLCVFHHRGMTLCLGAELSEINADGTELLTGLLVGLPLLLGTVAGGGWWLAQRALAPIRAITAATEQITVERLTQRLPTLWSRDEIGKLSEVLNAMFDRLEASFRQAMRFSADASHELKTPLSVLRVSIEDLLQSPTLGEADQRALSAMLEQTRHLSSITESLLLLARADAGRLKLDCTEVDLRELITACADDATIIAEVRQISLHLSLPDSLRACVESGRLTQILLNLLDNAVKFNHERGTVTILAESTENGQITIQIANTGPGIPSEEAARIFERFFRLEANIAQPGHGLGLSLARELARAHGGDLILKSCDPIWTVFELSIPGRPQ